MKKVKFGKDILFLTIFTLITVLTWVGLAVWSTATKTTINEVTQQQMAPLNPVIDKNIIESLKKTSYFSEEEMNFNNQSAITTESSQTTTESAILETR
jgi:hypothetical protein